MFVGADQTFDFQHLFEVTKVVTRNLNKIIDVNCYPIPEAQASNFRHRPIGIGVQVHEEAGLPGLIVLACRNRCCDWLPYVLCRGWLTCSF